MYYIDPHIHMISRVTDDYQRMAQCGCVAVTEPNGTLAGVIFAFMNIPLKDKLDQFEKWATANNPFFEGPWSDVLAMIPFIILMVLLYIVGRERWLAGKRSADAVARDLR